MLILNPQYDFTDLLVWDATDFYTWMLDIERKTDSYGDMPFETLNEALLAYKKHLLRIESKKYSLIEDFNNSPMGIAHAKLRRQLRRIQYIKKKTFSTNNLLNKE